VGDDPGQRRLAGAGRPVEDHRSHPVLSDRALQGAALADHVPLSGELVERLRPHPLRQRRLRAQTASGRVREQVICHAAGYTENVGTTARETVRLGGRLRNGIFVHSLDHWARRYGPEGELRPASGRAGAARGPAHGARVRGVLRMAEMGYLLPIMRRRLPEARLPIEGAAARLLWRHRQVPRDCGSRLSPLTAELLGASPRWRRHGPRGCRWPGYGAEHKAMRLRARPAASSHEGA
jgi:hypothetical protein